MKRCSREKCLIQSQQDKADALATSPAALSANVRKGSDLLSEVMAEDSRTTRIGLSARSPQSRRDVGEVAFAQTLSSTPKRTDT
jgi:hypothetical protein